MKVRSADPFWTRWRRNRNEGESYLLHSSGSNKKYLVLVGYLNLNSSTFSLVLSMTNLLVLPGFFFSCYVHISWDASCETRIDPQPHCVRLILISLVQLIYICGNAINPSTHYICSFLLPVSLDWPRCGTKKRWKEKETISERSKWHALRTTTLSTLCQWIVMSKSKLVFVLYA